MKLGKIVDVIETAPPVREIPADLLDDTPEPTPVTAGGEQSPVTVTTPTAD